MSHALDLRSLRRRAFSWGVCLIVTATIRPSALGCPLLRENTADDGLEQRLSQREYFTPRRPVAAHPENPAGEGSDFTFF